MCCLYGKATYTSVHWQFLFYEASMSVSIKVGIPRLAVAFPVQSSYVTYNNAIYLCVCALPESMREQSNGCTLFNDENIEFSK